MTIDQAIKFLVKEPGNVRGLGIQVRIDAIKLGIGALKRIKELRPFSDGFLNQLLPGETEE